MGGDKQEKGGRRPLLFFRPFIRTRFDRAMPASDASHTMWLVQRPPRPWSRLGLPADPGSRLRLISQPPRGEVQMAADNAHTGYALDSGSPKILWLSADRGSQQCPGTAPVVCVGGVRRPIRPTVTVFRAPSRRGGARWTDARCCAQFRRGRSAIATATYSGYLSQVHSQYAHYEDPK